MFNFNDISIHLSCQQFECNSLEFNPVNSTVCLPFKSILSTRDVTCPCCGGTVYVNETDECELKDAPIFFGIIQKVRVFLHRYQCRSCGRVFTEDIGILKYEGARITQRAATFVKELLRYHFPVSAISELTGIRWNTIRDIHEKYMDEILEERFKELREANYKPKYLAVDEFAIHRGHTYATCVMDLEQGDILWVGQGRAMANFRKFFEEYDLELLSDVVAFAMDMNASYNNLVEEYLPHAEIVYDRYHMQAQFGKDVLGSVRLEEAKEHQYQAKHYDELAMETVNPDTRRDLKRKAREERHCYSKIKGARWLILKAGENLKGKGVEALNGILDSHAKLSLCYAMKEEMCELFKLTDSEEARLGWTHWFQAAKESGIDQLVRFANQKEKRIEGLVAHAKFQISTGKLEGFNNKIKVVKRTGYGYRNDDYFFTLIKYLSIPSVRQRFQYFC